MITVDQVNTYRRLHAAGRIGKLFGCEGNFLLAPVDAMKWLEYSTAEAISDAALIRLINELDTGRKPPASETRRALYLSETA